MVQGQHTASYLGLVPHLRAHGCLARARAHYLLYGLYHATLLSGYDIFSRWNKKRKLWGDGRVWRAANTLLTCHVVAFGLLLFSGHITPHPLPRFEEVAEQVGCDGVSGWAWDGGSNQTLR